MLGDLQQHDPNEHMVNSSFRLQLTALPFDPHPDSRSYVHDFPSLRDEDDRICKQEPHPDAIHLPHPIPQPSDPYYHPHDASLHFPIPGILPPYPYISTHPLDHFALQPYQPPDPTNSALSPIVSHEYPDDYQDQQSSPTGNSLAPIKGQRKSRWRPTIKQREKLEASWLQDQYPNRNTKQAIAGELEGVTAEQVSRWFKHRRESFVQKGTFQYRNEAAAKFSNQQVVLLESLFKHNAYPSREDIKSLAESMQVSQQRVKNWFKARRCRLAHKREFEFKQKTGSSKTDGAERKRKSGDSPLQDEPYPKRNDYLPPIEHDGLSASGELHHSLGHTDLPQLSNTIHMHTHPHHVDVGSVLHGSLVEHILANKEHEHSSHNHPSHDHHHHVSLHHSHDSSIHDPHHHHLLHSPHDPHLHHSAHLHSSLHHSQDPHDLHSHHPHDLHHSHGLHHPHEIHDPHHSHHHSHDLHDPHAHHHHPNLHSHHHDPHSDPLSDHSPQSEGYHPVHPYDHDIHQLAHIDVVDPDEMPHLQIFESGHT